MPTAVQAVHNAYLAAAELAPERPRPQPAAGWREAVHAANEEIEISRPMIVFCGAVCSLIMGVLTGAWLQI